MRIRGRISVVGALAAMLMLLAACNDDDDGARVLIIPHGQITVQAYELLLRDLMSQQDSARFCEVLSSMDADGKVETVQLAPKQVMPLGTATPSPDDVDRAAELIDDACEEFHGEAGGS